LRGGSLLYWNKKRREQVKKKAKTLAEDSLGLLWAKENRAPYAEVGAQGMLNSTHIKAPVEKNSQFPVSRETREIPGEHQPI